MPTPKRGARLAGGPDQQKALLRNQATELFRHGRITTTHAKAKFLRPYAEKLITKGKKGDLHNRRLVLSELKDRDVVAHLFEEVAPRFADRPGGYTRIIKLGPRKGDNAPMALIELVDRGSGSAEEDIQEAKEQRSRGLFGRGRRRAAAAASAVADRVSGASDDIVETVAEATETVTEKVEETAENVAEAVDPDTDDEDASEDDSSEE